MTKTTEELKRDMCGCLARVSQMISDGCIPRMVFPLFEGILEQYLEALRQELKTSHEATGELAIQVQEAKAERDELRNKLQAFEYANKNAGELLRDALATVERQREYIRTLYTSRNARKLAGSTSGQKKSESAPQVKCGLSAHDSKAMSPSSCMHTTDFDGFCTFCRQKIGGAQ